MSFEECNKPKPIVILKDDPRRICNIAENVLSRSTPRNPYNKRAKHYENEKFYTMRVVTDTKEDREVGVYFPDITEDEFYSSMIYDYEGEIGFEIIKDMLTTRGCISKNRDLSQRLLVLFHLLHEEGHWKYFIKNYKNKNKVGSYYDDDYEEKNESLGINKIAKDCYTQCDEESRNKKIRAYMKLYREHPFEIYADNYAITKIKKNYLD